MRGGAESKHDRVMPDPIAISKTLSIRECGYDEYWLQDQIAADPGILGLGELEVVRREKLQSSGGKLDILLKEPEDEATASGETYDETWWKNRSASNLETAKESLKAVSSVYGPMELGFAKYYIALKTANNFFNQFVLKPRSGNKSLVQFWVNDA